MTNASTATRRHFLRGIGGASMVLPFLPSLQPREARGAVPNNKRFLYIGTEHGGASFANMYGTQGTTGASVVDLFAGNTAHAAPLSLGTLNGKPSLSPILTAANLTPSLAKKMTLIRGIDHANTVGHQEGAHLGNNSAQVGDRGPTLTPMVTIDQLMAYSPNFYGAQSPKVRSIIIGSSRSLSWTYQNPVALTGVQASAKYVSSVQLFNMLFDGSTTNPQPIATRPLIIDRVLANYQSLRNSNRRLSAADRTRLDDHVSQLTELQRRLKTSSATPLSCGSPTRPADSGQMWNKIGAGPSAVPLDQQTQTYKELADVMIAALGCGASRIGVFHELAQYSTYVGDWHQEIAHQDVSAGPQATLAASYQLVFENIFTYIAAGLDAIKDSDGSTALDNTLMAWSQECGYHTHDPYQFPIVMAGSAGGYFKTGQFVDYRNQVQSSRVYGSDHAAYPDGYAGLIYEQFLATALYSMGIGANEWKQPNGLPGYGDYKPDPDPDFFFVNPNGGKSVRTPGVIANASMPLPIIT